jgi:hypothetical protein
MAVGAYADMSTGIETTIGVTVIATGGGTGGIAIATENSGSLAETQRATVACELATQLSRLRLRAFRRRAAKEHISCERC